MDIGKNRYRNEKIKLRLEKIEELSRKKLPWGKVASKLNEIGLKQLNGAKWTIDSVISFYIIMSRKKRSGLLSKLLKFKNR